MLFRYKGEENTLPGSLALARMAGFDATGLESNSDLAVLDIGSVTKEFVVDFSVGVLSSIASVSCFL